LLNMGSLGRKPILRGLGAAFMLLLIVFGLLQTASPVLGTTVPVSPTPAGEGDKTPEASGEVAEKLPPPDLPTTSQQGYTFNLDASLKAETKKVPTEAPVYEMNRNKMTKAQAQKLADKLKIGAKVKARGKDGFTASGDGELFISPDVIQYQSGNEPKEGKLPTDDDAIANARKWLRGSGLTPPDLGEGKVVSRVEQANVVVVIFTPVEPDGLLAAYPSITVTMGPKGTVVEASKRWADIQPGDTYQLRSAEDAWKDIQAGEAYIEADLTDADFPAGADVSGSVTYNDISIGYTTAGPPGGTQYLEPVFVFKGRVRIEGKDGTYAIRAYVPALANSGAPVG
jgi:hypothetical protein